jgi:signal transduction histidine kinase
MPIVKNREAPDELMRKLLEANQNLVIASLRAQDLQDQAEASVQRQTEFLSMLAHELRNPLAPIAMAS